MSRIRIKYFGPIKEGIVNDGWIDINKVTIFTGNQGSGKSTVAKMISTMSWIEKALARGYFKAEDLTVSEFVARCAYQNTSNYFKINTEIDYEGNAFHIRYDNSKVTVKRNPANGYHFPKIMYVPAERNFVSSVSNVDNLKGLPQTLYTFSDEYLNALRDFSGSLTLPINDAQLEYVQETKRVQITGNGYHVDLAEASSGFQSFVPLYVVSLYLAKSLENRNQHAHNNSSIEMDRMLRKQIQDILSDPTVTDYVKQESLRLISAAMTYSAFINVVEEPELNLFPTSQRGMLNSLLEINNLSTGNKLIMTTHSPYLINYLTLAVKAKMLHDILQNSGIFKELENIVPVKSLLNADDLSIYEMNQNDGTIKLLEKINGIPSDENNLNERLEEGNELYAKLLELQHRER